MSEARSYLPAHTSPVAPCFSVDGCAELIDLLKHVFGAEETSRSPDPSGEKIWHAQVNLGVSSIFLADANPMMNPATQQQVWIFVPDVDATFAKATAAGMKGLMAPVDMFWGDRFARVQDRFGNSYSLATRVRDLTPQQMMEAQHEFVKQMSQGK